MDGNKLIMIFMGGLVGSSTKYPTGEYVIHSIHLNEKQVNDFENQVRYHTSFDWIMPVVEKIESLGYTVIIHHGSCYIQCNQTNRIINTAEKFETKIASIWQAITSFIQYYNSLKQ